MTMLALRKATVPNDDDTHEEPVVFLCPSLVNQRDLFVTKSWRRVECVESFRQPRLSRRRPRAVWYLVSPSPLSRAQQPLTSLSRCPSHAATNIALELR